MTEESSEENVDTQEEVDEDSTVEDSEIHIMRNMRKNHETMRLQGKADR